MIAELFNFISNAHKNVYYVSAGLNNNYQCVLYDCSIVFRRRLPTEIFSPVCGHVH